MAGFLDILNSTRHNGGLEQPKCQIPAFNVMTMCARRQTNSGKQITLLDGVDVGRPKQHVCLRGLNRSVHDVMNNTLNVKVHFKTRIEKYVTVSEGRLPDDHFRYPQSMPRIL